MNRLANIFCHRNIILVTVGISVFMLPVDFYATSIALPDIGHEFDSSKTEMMWTGSLFMVAYTAMLMIGGVLADRYARKMIYHTGIVIFALSSLLCGIAGSLLMLDLSRIFQGVGAAFMFSSGISLLMQEFKGKDRNYAFSLFGLLSGIGTVIGPLVGSLIIRSIGWRFSFLINVPVCVLLLAIFWHRVREPADKRVGHLDLIGFLMYSLAFAGLLYTVIEMENSGWESLQTLPVLIISLLLFLYFFLIEKRSPFPLLDIKLFSRSGYLGTVLASLIFGMTFWCMILYVSIYFQSVLGYTPVEAGFALLPFVIPMFLMGPVIRQLNKITDPRNHMAFGLLLISAGALSMLFIPEGDGWLYFFPGAVIAATGSKIINGYLINLSMAMVPERHSGMAAGITTTIRQIGFALSIAVVSIIATVPGNNPAPVNLVFARTAPVKHHNAYTRPAAIKYKEFDALLEFVVIAGLAGTLMIMLLVPKGLLVQEEKMQNFCGFNPMRKLRLEREPDDKIKL